MNAVIRKPDASGDFDVVVSEDVPMQEGFGELRADVRHIRSEATDIKADVRATNVRLDDLRKEMNLNIQGIRNEFGKKLDDLADGMNTRIDGVTSRIDGVTSRIDKTREELAARIDDVKERVDNGQRETSDKIESIQNRMDFAQKELVEKIDGVKGSLAQSTVWALGLYIGLAGALLLVIAHGFKWL